MDSKHYEKVNDVFLQACDLDAGLRSAFLDDACRGDAKLRSDVEALLAHDARPNRGVQFASRMGVVDVLARRIAAGNTNAEFQGVDRIEHFTLLRVIGEGGMGTVYEARQDHPSRLVALKVIRPGIASGPLLDRFRREADILGRLQHPGIAQIYEAGVAKQRLPGGTSFEQPYFAMELVDGATLDHHIKQASVSQDQKLLLFTEICDAVQHAHDRGVIHRDLKPSNILVTPMGKPKVLDFGVSRATDGDVHTVSLQTDVGQLIGTIAYMSPEQAEGDPEKIDARSDVYALGVILFEMLAGRLPIVVRGRSIAEAARLIREQDASRLSTLDSRFRGDVDVIVQKALEKDRQRRYRSAGELGADVRRFLDNEPISAHPPSRIYQMRKFARRHRALVGGVLGVFVALVAGVIGTGFFAWRAAEQRDEARREAGRVQALNTFLIDDLFGNASPRSGASHDLPVSEMLANAAAAIEDSFAGEPDIEALIRSTLGNILLHLGQFEQAEAHLRRATTLARSIWRPTSPESIDVRRNYGSALWRNANLPEAQRVLEELLADQQRHQGGDQVAVADTLRQLASVTYNMGDYAKAEGLYRQAKVLYEDAGYDGADALASVSDGIAAALLGQNKVDEAIQQSRDALALAESHQGKEHIEVTMFQHNLGTILSNHGEYQEGDELLRSALATRRRILGDESPDIADTLFQLGRSALRQRNYEQAAALGEEALAIQQDKLHPEHVDLAETHDLLGAVAMRRKQFAVAERHFRESRRIYVAVHGLESRANALMLGSIGVSLLKQERFTEAIEIHQQALARTKSVFGEQSATRYLCQTSLGACLTGAGKYAQSEALLLEAYEFLAEADHPRAQWAGKTLAALYNAWGKPAKAEAYVAGGDAEVAK